MITQRRQTYMRVTWFSIHSWFYASIYGRPLSVSGRPCYILPMFLFIYLFILWPPYSPALVNGGSRKFYTWWSLSVIEEVTTWLLDVSFPRRFVPWNETSIYGRFVLWTFRSLDDSFSRRFVPWTIRSLDVSFSGRFVLSSVYLINPRNPPPKSRNTMYFDF